jgi:hypothetical protein
MNAGTSFIEVKYLPGSNCGAENSVLKEAVVIGLAVSKRLNDLPAFQMHIERFSCK